MFRCCNNYISISTYHRSTIEHTCNIRITFVTWLVACLRFHDHVIHSAAVLSRSPDRRELLLARWVGARLYETRRSSATVSGCGSQRREHVGLSCGIQTHAPAPRTKLNRLRMFCPSHSFYKLVRWYITTCIHCDIIQCIII